jgi:hypothetical protein
VNLLFLVEGAITEDRTYRAWISHLFPHLNFVAKPEESPTHIELSEVMAIPAYLAPQKSMEVFLL